MSGFAVGGVSSNFKQWKIPLQYSNFFGGILSLDILFFFGNEMKNPAVFLVYTIFVYTILLASCYYHIKKN